MNMTFSPEDCARIAGDLNASSGKLNTILNEDLVGSINRARANYSSQSAEELYAAFEKVRSKFPEFIEAIQECSRHLTEDVGAYVSKVETDLSSSIN